MDKVKKQAVRKKVMDTLGTVMDPELHMSITDLGLVYDVKVSTTKKTNIIMTLTSLGCPLFPMIEQDIHNKLFQAGIKDISVTLTFDPPWSMERMTERAKATLGI